MSQNLKTLFAKIDAIMHSDEESARLPHIPSLLHDYYAHLPKVENALVKRHIVRVLEWYASRNARTITVAP